jgi:hypothetical protein
MVGWMNLSVRILLAGAVAALACGGGGQRHAGDEVTPVRDIPVVDASLDISSDLSDDSVRDTASVDIEDTSPPCLDACDLDTTRDDLANLDANDVPRPEVVIDVPHDCTCAPDVQDVTETGDDGCMCPTDIVTVDTGLFDPGQTEDVPDTALTDSVQDHAIDGHIDTPQDVVDPCSTAGHVCTITLGHCRSDGLEVCKPDGSGTECNAPAITIAADDDCDGKDQDCDGVPDNHYVPTPSYCGTGSCASTGWLTCAGGKTADTCAPRLPATEDATCNGLDDDCNGLTDDVTRATSKRVVLNCYEEVSHLEPLPVADCWSLLSPGSGVAPPTNTKIALQFVDASVPCDQTAGMNLCLSSAITTCTDETLLDGCISLITFEVLILGTQYRYTAASGNVQFAFDQTRDPKVAAMQVLHVPPGAMPGCTILFNTFSCPACN